jgi:hypothetical protein
MDIINFITKVVYVTFINRHALLKDGVVSITLSVVCHAHILILYGKLKLFDVKVQNAKFHVAIFKSFLGFPSERASKDKADK